MLQPLWPILEVPDVIPQHRVTLKNNCTRMLLVAYRPFPSLPVMRFLSIAYTYCCIVFELLTVSVKHIVAVLVPDGIIRDSSHRQPLHHEPCYNPCNTILPWLWPRVLSSLTAFRYSQGIWIHVAIPHSCLGSKPNHSPHINKARQLRTSSAPDCCLGP